MPARLHYLWSWDVEREGPMTMTVTSGALSGTVTVSSGALVHSLRMPYGGATDTWPVAAFGLSSFAGAVETTIAPGTLRVRYTPGVGYTLFLTAFGQLDFSLDFSSHGAAGERMRRALGFSGDRAVGDMIAQNYGGLTGNAHRSNVRPVYQILPAIEARSEDSDEYDPPGITAEAVGDDGDDVQTSRDTDELWRNWSQAAETNEARTAPFEPGTPVHRRFNTAEVPWSYQDAFRHMRRGKPPFLVFREGDAEPEAFTMRAAGVSFTPTRFAGRDYPIFTIPFQTRAK